MADEPTTTANRKARDERKEAHLRAILDRYTQRFRAAGNEDAPSVAREVHGTIDDVLKRDREKDATSGAIQCRKGCSHCCHGPVEIWPQEAALLVKAAREAGIELDQARLERQGRQTIDTWRQQPRADTACVFLGGDGACRVYESRPNACRKLLVVSDPALCDAGNQSLDRVERWLSWESEVLETAALEVFGRGLMPGLLLAELRAETLDAKAQSRKEDQ
jgi:Fe-S-cluster containining protein